MATLTKNGVPSLATLTPGPECVVAPGVIAGEAIAAGDVCVLTADANFPFGSKWMRANGTSNNAAAKADGIAVKRASANEPVTCMTNVELDYGAALTPAARYYVSATAGALDDAATTGGTAYVAYAVDATRIRFVGSRY